MNFEFGKFYKVTLSDGRVIPFKMLGPDMEGRVFVETYRQKRLFEEVFPAYLEVLEATPKEYDTFCAIVVDMKDP